MRIQTVLLEEWLRTYYFETEVDISCSGVRNFSFPELRTILNLTLDDLDQVVFNDGHSFGSPPLRRQIAQRWSNGDADRVIVTHGSSEAIYLLMNVLLEPGDEVVVLDPVYPQLFAIAQAMGCRIVRWPLRFEQQFTPDFAQVRSLVSSRTRMIVVNFPHNPTGASITLAQQDELLELAARAGAYLVWDGAFTDLVYDGRPLPDPSVKYDRCVSLGTLSKGYGLAGLRVGWCLAPPEVLERCVRFRDYLTLHLSPLVEVIATRAVTHGDRLLVPRLAEARINLELLAQWVREHEPLVQWVRPQGGVCGLLRFGALRDVTAFCHELAREHGVLVVPGACFEQPDCVRVGFGGSTAELEEGLRRIARCLIHHPDAPSRVAASAAEGDLPCHSLT